jgi:hypothetical protein
VAPEVIATQKKHDQRDAVGNPEGAMSLGDEQERERHRERGEEYQEKDTYRSPEIGECKFGAGRLWKTDQAASNGLEFT